MVADIYTDLAEMAVELIGELGKDAAIVREEKSGPPHAPVITPVAHPCKVADIGYSMTNRDATLIQTGDKVGIISPDLGVAPGLHDLLRIDGADYRFVDLQPLNPGGLTVIWEYTARQ